MGDKYDDKISYPVLLNEAIQGLKISPKGVYIDATFGGEVILKLFWKC